MRPLIYTVFILITSFVFGQGCYIDVSPTFNNICAADSFNLSAQLYATNTPVLFSGDTLPLGWSEGTSTLLPSLSVGTNCNPHPNGFSNVQFRSLETDSIQINCTGAKLHFDFATGNDELTINPGCDATDIVNEGVYIDISINGGSTYTPFKYIRPDGVIFDLGSSPNITTNYAMSHFLETFRDITIDLPDSLVNETIKLHFHQDVSSGIDYDLFFITNIAFSGAGTNCNTSNPYTLVWNNGLTNTSNTSVLIHSDSIIQAFGLDVLGDTICESLPLVFNFLDQPVLNIVQTQVNLPCPNSTVTINLEFQNAKEPYSFTQNGTYNPADSTFSFDVVNIADTSYFFHLSAMDSCGNVFSDSVLINAPNYFPPTLFLNADTVNLSGCPNANFTIILDSINYFGNYPSITFNNISSGSQFDFGGTLSPGDTSYVFVQAIDQCNSTTIDSVLFIKDPYQPTQAIVHTVVNDSTICSNNLIPVKIDSIIGGIAPLIIYSTTDNSSTYNYPANVGDTLYMKENLVNQAGGYYNIKIKDACYQNTTQNFPLPHINWYNTYDFDFSFLENVGLNNGIVILDSVSGVNYSLYDCNSMTTIPTPNGISNYIIDTLDNFALIATNQTCMDTSDCFTIDYQSDCNFYITTNSNLICVNDSAIVDFYDVDLNILDQETFNNTQLPSGWTANTSYYDLNSTCTSHPLGYNFIKFNSSYSTLTHLTTKTYNIPCGNAAISFELQHLFGIAAWPSPCQGPFKRNEGLIVEYSSDNGNTWDFIKYIYPDGSTLDSVDNHYFNNIQYPNNPLATWTSYYFPIPEVFNNSSVQFRFTPNSSSSTSAKHYFLTNFKVFNTGSPCSSNYNFVWNNGVQNQPTIAIPVNGNTPIYAEVYDTNNNYLCTTDTLVIDNYPNIIDFLIFHYDTVQNCPDEIITFDIGAYAGGITPYNFNFLAQDSTTTFFVQDTSLSNGHYAFPVTMTDGCGITKTKHFSFTVDNYYTTDSIITGIDLNQGTYGIVYADTAGVDQIQWVNCDSSYAAVAQQFNTIPFEFPYEGNFAMIVETAGCIDTTNCYASNTANPNPNAGLSPSKIDNITVSPNPFKEKLIVEHGQHLIQQVSLVNAAGQLMNISPQYKEGIFEISTQHLAPGSYLLFLSTATESRVIKLIKL